MDSLRKAILAKSSSGDFYNVEFLLEPNKVRIFCHCAAGQLQQLCKHKLALITGNTAMLFDPSQADDLLQIRSWPSFARIQERLARFESEMATIEQEKAQLSKREKETKSAFGRELTFGVS